jgi:putative transposase
MTIRPELLDELLKDYAKPEDLVGEGGLLKQLTKALVERCLDTEMAVHLDQPHYKTEGKAKRNRRNGHSQRPSKTSLALLPLRFPVTVIASSSQSSSRRGRPVLMDSMARSCPCMVGA